MNSPATKEKYLMRLGKFYTQRYTQQWDIVQQRRKNNSAKIEEFARIYSDI
jgi:hypothetical protein